MNDHFISDDCVRSFTFISHDLVFLAFCLEVTTSSSTAGKSGDDNLSISGPFCGPSDHFLGTTAHIFILPSSHIIHYVSNLMLFHPWTQVTFAMLWAGDMTSSMFSYFEIFVAQMLLICVQLASCDKAVRVYPPISLISLSLLNTVALIYLQISTTNIANYLIIIIIRTH